MQDGDDGLLDALFEDLEQQAAGLEAAERDAELADRVRGEYATVGLADRFHASLGHDVGLVLHGGHVVEGRLTDAGRGWCAVRPPYRPTTWLVRLPAVSVARGMSARAAPEAARPAVSRLGLGSALHRFTEGVPDVGLHLVSGAPWQARVLRVGADFVEVLRLPGGDAGASELVSFDALRAVHIGAVHHG
jgi:hypothetical protein